MLSPGIQQQLEAARQYQSTYQPNAATARSINNKTLVMLIGPVAVGKTFVMNQVLALDPAFARASDLTTREPRSDDDPDTFRYLPHDDTNVRKILDKVRAGEFVQYAVHPTTGRIYATESEDFPGRYNLLATLSTVAEHLQALPFARIYTVGVAAEPTIWQKRLNTRYPQPSEERQKRLQEALTSIEWLLAHGTIWIDNSHDFDITPARQLIDIVKYDHLSAASAEAKAHVEGMREIARSML